MSLQVDAVDSGSFSIGIAYTSVWFPRSKQGFALGIFGAGNAGSAITTLVAPTLLNTFTANGSDIDAWRRLPVAYAAVLAVTGVVFFLATTNKKPLWVAKTFAEQLAP
ncbi:MAG: hypothetical protein KBF52_15060, partial [Pyrinomonadaceae bacterium]|nr:hypothetical protein [Pyrinomonadaceae bacterium]MBP9937084.1 hypothetical protein [Pyrinomonadaceae bacterium]